jgi:hypothetical protein
MIRYLFFFVLILSCDNYLNNDSDFLLAKVDDELLKFSEVQGNLDFGSSKEDSILILNNYINNWVSDKLLIKKALLNIPDNNINQIESLVNNYKNELIISSYLDAVIDNSMNLEVFDTELDSIYNYNKHTFVLSEELYQYRYLYISDINPDFSLFKSKLKRFNEVDRVYLDSLSFQLINFSFNDSTWRNKNEILSEIPKLKKINKNLLKKPNFIQLKDSLGLYLVKINKVLKIGDYAPIEYVSETLKRMVINKRKLEFIDQIRKEITNEAIKNKSLEIF